MTDGDPLDVLFEEIEALHRAAGAPSYERIKAYANIDGRRVLTSSISNLAKRTTNPRLETVLGFVIGCEGYARNQRTQLPTRLCDHARWTEMVEAASRRSGADTSSLATSLPDLDENYLSHHAWEWIHQLISALPAPVGEDHVRRLLWSAVDEIGPLTVKGPFELLSVLRALDTGFVPQGSLSPALVLLEYLAATQHTTVRRKIQLLVNELSASTGVPIGEVTRIRMRAAAPFRDDDPVAVFVKVQGNGNPGYRLTAWLYRPGKPLTFKYEAEDCCGASQLRTAVEDLITQLAPLARGLPFPQLQMLCGAGAEH